jgi:hypothetical protein
MSLKLKDLYFFRYLKIVLLAFLLSQQLFAAGRTEGQRQMYSREALLAIIVVGWGLLAFGSYVALLVERNKFFKFKRLADLKYQISKEEKFLEEEQAKILEKEEKQKEIEKLTGSSAVLTQIH